jgi:hypothetical protein
MSRRRRRGGNNSKQQQQHQQHQHQQQSAAAAKADEVEAFWGPEAADEAAAVQRIRPTPEPAALPRSLGDPPLTPDTAAAHHVAVVYEEAVRAATALAAANSLLELDPEPPSLDD